MIRDSKVVWTPKILRAVVAGALGSAILMSRPALSAEARDPGLQTDRPVAADRPCEHDRQPDDPDPIEGLTPEQLKLFCAGADEFAHDDKVDEGLGPTMNLNSCRGCHWRPQSGGSSRPENPQWT
jgi:hypothetical protein